jgi:ABC-type Fe3+/spermidine/putrescine transport system ATPase subunit
MPKAIDLELLQLLEDKLGKETAGKVAQAIELGLEVMEKRAEELAIQKKLELKDELTKELASKADIQVLKAEIQAVRTEMQAMEAKLEAKIEKVRSELREEILRLDRKFTILFIILFFTLILVNQNALEFLLKVLGLIK